MRRGFGQAAWFVVPLALCPVVALLQPGTEQDAMARAEWLLAWQRRWGVAVEPSIHAWFVARPALLGFVVAFYFGAHLAALIATACWLASRDRPGFCRFRRTFALAQVVTIVVYLTVPVAPLRMVLGGGSHPAGGGWTRSMQYEFAALPSGHIVFALIVAIAIWEHAPAAWRWLAVAHPACTIVAVVATAHHSFVDIAAAGFVAAGSAVAVRAVVGRTAASRIGAAPMADGAGR